MSEAYNAETDPHKDVVFEPHEINRMLDIIDTHVAPKVVPLVDVGPDGFKPGQLVDFGARRSGKSITYGMMFDLQMKLRLGLPVIMYNEEIDSFVIQQQNCDTMTVPKSSLTEAQVTQALLVMATGHPAPSTNIFWEIGKTITAKGYERLFDQDRKRADHQGIPLLRASAPEDRAAWNAMRTTLEALRKLDPKINEVYEKYVLGGDDQALMDLVINTNPNGVWSGGE